METTVGPELDLVHDLVTWAKAHEATLDDRVQIVDSPEYGISLRVGDRQSRITSAQGSDGLPANTSIVSCPFKLSLSYLNTLDLYDDLRSHSDLFPQPLFEALAPHAIGNFFLVQQYLAAQSSYWAPYISSLPQPHEFQKLNTPLYWIEKDKEWLQGTIIEQAAIQREETWRAEFELGSTILNNCLELQHFHGQWTWDLYKWAATIFSSRSFVSTLIPREVFTAKLPDSSRIGEPSRHVSVSSQIQKQLPFSPYLPNLDTSTLLDAGPYPILFPLVDLANHSPRARVTWFSNASVQPRDLRIITETEISSGDQIFNNYAPKSNTELLLGYGFILPGNDEVAVAFKSLPDDLLSIRKNQHSYLKRSQSKTEDNVFQIRQNGYLRQEGENYFKEFKFYEEGCIDTLSLFAANQRERDYMAKNPSFSAERYSGITIGGVMSRNVLIVVSVLRDKLQNLLSGLVSTGQNLGIPETPSQRIASAFREGQLQTLRETIEPLKTRLKEVIHQGINALPPAISEAVHKSAELWTLEYAFGLESSLDIWKQAQFIIRSELEIGAPEKQMTPLDYNDWKELEDEEWEYTIWCFWVYILLLNDLIGAQGPSEKLGNWRRFMTTTYKNSDSWPGDREFLGHKDELETLKQMVDRVTSLSSIELEKETLGNLLILASVIVSEESFYINLEKTISNGDGDREDSTRGRRVMCITP